MQSIVTKFIGPTNTRGSRVKALADAGSLTTSWDYSLNTDENHRAAAMALVDKLDWHYADYIEGSLPQNNPYHMVYVCQVDHSTIKTKHS